MNIFIDASVNRGRPHIQLLLVLFRVAQAVRRPRMPRLVRIVFAALYRVPALFLFSIDIPVSTKIGPRVSIHHGIGLVVNSDAVIGSDVTFRQGVTVGNIGGGPSPRIGDHVNVGASAIILGDLDVGRNAAIGAGAVVTKDVAPFARVVGNPARELG